MSELIKINQITIDSPVIDGVHCVAVGPICQALRVDSSVEFRKIKDDPILGPTVKTTLTVGADSQNSEMFCLPLRYVYGWIFSIEGVDPVDIADCYNRIFDHFSALVRAKKA